MGKVVIDCMRSKRCFQLVLCILPHAERHVALLRFGEFCSVKINERDEVKRWNEPR